MARQRELTLPTATTRAEFLATMRAETDTCLLAFSRGKDSLAAWITLLAAGFRVIPFHMALVPGLSFVDESLAYYERFFGAHIYRLLHPNFFHWVRTLSFQPPARCALLSLDATNAGLLRRWTYPEINRRVASMAGLPADTWVAVGTRAVDSRQRHMVLNRYGPKHDSTRTFWPIFDMRKAEQVSLLQRAGVRLPRDYALFGRSFDGIDWAFLQPIHDQCPEDYQRILHWFPLAHLELVRARLAEESAHAA